MSKNIKKLGEIPIDIVVETKGEKKITLKNGVTVHFATIVRDKPVPPGR